MVLASHIKTETKNPCFRSHIIVLKYEFALVKEYGQILLRRYLASFFIDFFRKV